MKSLLNLWRKLSLIKQIIIGLTLGILLGVYLPTQAQGVSLLGTLFVGALKSIAPILVFVLVMAALSNQDHKSNTHMRSVIGVYILGTFLSALTAVVGSFLFPVTITFAKAPSQIAPPSGIQEVLKNLLMSLVENPIEALSKANYIGILTWAILLGLALRKASPSTKEVISNFSDGISTIVKWVISFAPLGIMGLVYASISENGIKALLNYGQLLALLVGSMVFVALVVNPLIAFFILKENPYPLVFKCLKRSGLTAFFTRSSAANIPVNMELCEELKLDRDFYSVSIPLGATINMAGAAITITTLTLATAHTLGTTADLPTSLILSILATVSACGASGVSGGSMLLIPLACSLFGINNEIASQVVGIGFIIGVIQDSCETGLNSSTDVLFTAIVDMAQRKKNRTLNS